MAAHPPAKKMLGIIHIGAEKTGTTTLQEAFHLNRARLAEAGVAFPSTPGARQHGLLALYAMDDGRDNRLTRLMPASFVDRGAWRAGFAAGLEREISGLPGDRLLISTELLHSQVRTPGEVSRLKSLLDSWCDRYLVVFYMRRQDRALASRYSSDLRAGGTEGPPFGKAVSKRLFNYEGILDLWSGVFGRENVVPRIFSQAALRGGDIVADFLHAAGLPIDPSTLALPPRRNSSLSRAAQQFLLAYNRSVAQMPTAADGGRLQRLLADAIETACPGAPGLPARDQAMAFYAPYRAGNARIAEQWFEGRQLFDEDFDDYPIDPESATLEAADAISIAARLLRCVAENSILLDENRLQQLLASGAPAFPGVLAGFAAERSPELAARISGAQDSARGNE